jgi:hypothetical protein
MTAPIAGQIRKVSPAAARVIQQAASRRQTTPAATTRKPRETAFLRSLTAQERTIREWILRGDNPWDERFIPPSICEHLLQDPAVERAVDRWAVQQRIRRRGIR